MYRLRTIGPPYETFPLKTGAYRLGSAPDSEMVIQDPSVAPYHCELVVTAKTIILRDLSPNKDTFVNDEQIQYTRLEMGQTLRLGGVTLVLEDAGGEAAASGSETTQSQPRAVAVAKKSVRAVKPLALPAMALLGVAGIVALIWYSTNQESGAPEKPGRSEEKRSSRDTEKKEDEPPRREEVGSNEARKRAGGADQGRSNPGAARASRPVPAVSVAAFHPGQTNRAPALDIQDAEVYLRTARYIRAEPFLQRALRNQVRTLNPEHPEVTKTLETMGRLYVRDRQFKKAEPFLQQVLMTTEKTRGPQHPEAAAAAANLGELYKASGQYTKAAPMFDRAVKAKEQSLGPGHPDVADNLNNLAEVYGAQGEHAKAKPHLERTLRIYETNLPPTDPRVAEALTDLGELHLAMGDAEAAEPLLQQALNAKEKNSPADVNGLTRTLNDLASVHAEKGENARAEQLYQKALKTVEGAYGPENAKTLPSLNHLAEHYRDTGDPAKAAAVLQRATNVAEKALGPEHPETGKSLKNLAELEREKGDSSKAEPLLDRASKTLEKTLGPDHPETVESLEDLASINLCEGGKNRPPQTGGKAVQATARLLAAIVSYASEPQRLDFHERLDPYSVAASMDAVPELSLAILRYKGIILDSLLEERLTRRATVTANDRAMIDELRTLKEQLAQLVFAVPEDLSAAAQQQRQAAKLRLAKDAEVLEGVLAHHVSGLGRTRDALRVTVAAVQQAVPEQAALVELARYSRCQGTNQWEPAYGALVLAANGSPQWVALGSAKAIEESVENYRNAIRGLGTARASQPQPGQAPETQNQKTKNKNSDSASPASTNSGTGDEFSALLRTLYQQVWAPIETALPPAAKTVIISPDGALNLVSFATLLTPDDQFLGQKYFLRYASSGRDLLNEKKSAPKDSVFVLCNPDFTNQELIADKTSADNPSSIRFLDRKDLETLRLAPIPDTLKEAAILETHAKKWNWPSRAFGGAGASEAQLTALQSPRILHLAGHTFALATRSGGPSPAPRQARSFKSLSEQSMTPTATPSTSTSGAGGYLAEKELPRNTLHRCGLVLAGGQATLKAWNRGEIPPPDNDGIVTAAEVGTLKLLGTELVVLSASSVELGGVHSADGVSTLRRGFVQSGAANLLMGLWTVADAASTSMLGEFYERFKQTGNAPHALAEVQRDWLNRTRKEQGVEAAVRLAGGLVMSSQGPQRAM